MHKLVHVVCFPSMRIIQFNKLHTSLAGIDKLLLPCISVNNNSPLNELWYMCLHPHFYCQAVIHTGALLR